MKQAFLILTKDVDEEFLNLIKTLDSKNHTLFIHVDKKSGEFSKKWKNNIVNSDIIFVPRVSVTWGGYSIVRAELNLLEAALEYGDFGHFHLLSGEDFPVKNNEQIDIFFNEHIKENFIEVSERIPNETKGRFNLRYNQYHILQDGYVGKKRNIFKYIDFLSCYVQKWVGVNRTSDIKIQSGAQWFSINSSLARYIVQNKSWINKYFKNTYCPDEAFIQSLIANTDYMNTLFERGTVNLRYVQFYWKAKHELTPRYINLNDINLIEDKKYFFARKFKKEISQEFIKHF